MKSILKVSCIAFLLGIVMFSCTVEKRIHNSGYHIQWKNKNRHNPENEPVKSNTVVTAIPQVLKGMQQELPETKETIVKENTADTLLHEKIFPSEQQEPSGKTQIKSGEKQSTPEPVKVQNEKHNRKPILKIPQKRDWEDGIGSFILWFLFITIAFTLLFAGIGILLLLVLQSPVLGIVFLSLGFLILITPVLCYIIVIMNS